MSGNFFNFVVIPVLAWLALLSLGVVGHLLWLELKDFARNRRMDQERERLGLRRSY